MELKCFISQAKTKKTISADRLLSPRSVQVNILFLLYLRFPDTQSCFFNTKAKRLQAPLGKFWIFKPCL